MAMAGVARPEEAFPARPVRLELLAALATLVLLTPVWWLLGIEQFLWPPALAVLALLAVQQRRGVVRVCRSQRWLLAFLAVFLLSGFGIVEPFRWLSFARNLGTFASAFLLLFLIVDRVRSWGSVRVLTKTVVITMTLASVIGLLGVIGVWRPGFRAPVAEGIPSALAESSFGRQIVERTTGRMGWWRGVGRYFRPTGFFLFPTLFASALAYTLPFAFFLIGHGRTRWGRRAASVAALLMVAALVFSTSRVAFLATACGAGCFAAFYSRRRKLLLPIAFLALIMVVGTFVVVPVEAVSAGAGSMVDRITTARGGGSFEHRFEVYRASLVGAAERPLLGWGTERDVPGSQYPAGSHSFYLGMLYRHGIVGLIAILGVLASLWRESRPPPVGVWRHGSFERAEIADFLRFGRWALIAVLVDSVATVPMTDMTTAVILWTTLALLVAARNVALTGTSEGEARP